MVAHPHGGDELGDGADEPRVVMAIVGAGLPDLWSADVRSGAGSVEDDVAQDVVGRRRDLRVDHLARLRGGLPQDVALRVGDADDGHWVHALAPRREGAVRVGHL